MDDTERHHRKAPRISEDTVVLVKVGSLVSGAIALVMASIWVYQVKLDCATALAEQRAFRLEMQPVLDQHRRLWWDYETRTANRPSHPALVGP